MLEQWITIIDKNTCPDCLELSNQVAETSEWEGRRPEDGVTLCDGNCRCELIPIDQETAEDEAAIQKIIDSWDGLTLDEIQQKVIDDIFKGISIDKYSGKAIVLDHFKDVTGVSNLSFENAARFDKKFDRMTDLIIRWHEDMGQALPDEWYEILTIDGKIKWLEQNT